MNDVFQSIVWPFITLLLFIGTGAYWIRKIRSDQRAILRDVEILVERLKDR